MALWLLPVSPAGLSEVGASKHAPLRACTTVCPSLPHSFPHTTPHSFPFPTHPVSFPLISPAGTLAGTWEKLSHTQGSYRYRGTSPIPSRRDVEEESMRAQLCNRRGNKRAGHEGTHFHSVTLPKEGFIWGLDFPSLSLL